MEEKVMSYGFEIMDYEIPQNKISIEDLVTEAGYGADMIERLQQGGLRFIPQNIDCTLDKLINKAILKIKNKIPDFEKRIKGVILAHSLPFLAPANIPFFDYCFKNTNLENTPRIAISGQPCSILHQAVQISMSWLSKEENDCGILLIGADQANSPQERIFFNSAMGDAAFVGIISQNANNNLILSSVTETEIIACEGEMSAQKDIQEFRAKNPSLIRHCIESALDEAKIAVNDVRYIITHTPYHSIWDLMASLLRIPREKILDDYIVDTGHLNSNDSFCHYIRACNEKRLCKDDIAVLINPGFGGSRGCTVIRV